MKWLVRYERQNAQKPGTDELTEGTIRYVKAWLSNPYEDTADSLTTQTVIETCLPENRFDLHPMA